MATFKDNSFSLLHEEIFKKGDIPRDKYASYFQNWLELYSCIYYLQSGAEELYTQHAILVLSITRILEQHQLKPDFSLIQNMFGWISNPTEYIERLSIPDFQEIESIYPELVSPQTRHALGEIYTPPELANFVVQHLLEAKTDADWTVLDPACGSGTFLLSFFNLLSQSSRYSKQDLSKYLANFVGFDLNPLAVFTCKANMQLICARQGINQPKTLKIYVIDPLFERDPNNTKKKYTVIVGNPPWYNLGAVQSREYQEKLKTLARQLDVYPTNSANIPNIEIASLFLRYMSQNFLTPGGLIAFLMPRNILKGSQNARTRYFHNLSDVEFWDFGQTPFFPVEFVALFAKEAGDIVKSNISDFCVQYRRVKSSRTNGTDRWQFELGQTHTYSPVFVDLEKNDVGRFIPEKVRTQIPPLGESPYAQKFHNGARLGPRSLLFVVSDRSNYDEIEIQPDPEGVKTSRGRWKRTPYEKAKVHRENLFRCVMSRSLLPFYIMGTKTLFLPMSPNLQYNPESMNPHSRAHFALLSREYQKSKKIFARQETLWDYIAYNGKTTNPLQTRSLKVIYNSIGRKRVKATVLHEPVLVDDSLYYYAPEIEAEAYYLAAILNSNLVSFAVVNIKDERNIHKNPWRLPIPIWQDTILQRKIELMGRSMEETIKKNLSNRSPAQTRKELETQILVWIEPDLRDLDLLVKKLFAMER